MLIGEAGGGGDCECFPLHIRGTGYFIGDEYELADDESALLDFSATAEELYTFGAWTTNNEHLNPPEAGIYDTAIMLTFEGVGGADYSQACQVTVRLYLVDADDETVYVSFGRYAVVPTGARVSVVLAGQWPYYGVAGDRWLVSVDCAALTALATGVELYQADWMFAKRCCSEVPDRPSEGG